MCLFCISLTPLQNLLFSLPLFPFLFLYNFSISTYYIKLNDPVITPNIFCVFFFSKQQQLNPHTHASNNSSSSRNAFFFSQGTSNWQLGILEMYVHIIGSHWLFLSPYFWWVMISPLSEIIRLKDNRLLACMCWMCMCVYSLLHRRRILILPRN